MESGNYFIVSKIKTKINVIQGILDLIQGLQFIFKMYTLRLLIKNFNITCKIDPKNQGRNYAWTKGGNGPPWPNEEKGNI